MLMNVYRYAQTAENSTILYWLGKKRVIFLNLVVFCTFAGLHLIPTNVELLGESEMKRLYEKDYPNIYAEIKDQGLFGLRSFHIIAWTSLMVYLGLFFVVCTICTVLSYKKLRVMKPQLTPKTYIMFRRFSDVLLIEEIIYAICGGALEVVVVFGLIAFEWYYYNVIVVFCFILLYSFPLLTILVTVFYVEPYKK